MKVFDLIRCLWKGRIIGNCLICHTPIYSRQSHQYFDKRFNEAWRRRNEIPKAYYCEVHDQCAVAYCIHHEQYWF